MFYYLHIPLPHDLEQAVAQLEERHQGNSRSKPHLTVIRPRALKPETSESTLIERLQQTQRQLEPFEIHYHGVGYFGNFHTIYIGHLRMSLAP